MVWWMKKWFGSLGPESKVNGSYFAWRPVASGVLQGSVLVVFNIFINDLEEEMKYLLLRFAPNW